MRRKLPRCDFQHFHKDERGGQRTENNKQTFSKEAETHSTLHHTRALLTQAPTAHINNSSAGRAQQQTRRGSLRPSFNHCFNTTVCSHRSFKRCSRAARTAPLTLMLDLLVEAMRTTDKSLTLCNCRFIRSRCGQVRLIGAEQHFVSHISYLRSAFGAEQTWWGSEEEAELGLIGPRSSCLMSLLACEVVNWLTMSSAVWL